jgi:hypothetical protein
MADKLVVNIILIAFYGRFFGGPVHAFDPVLRVALVLSVCPRVLDLYHPVINAIFARGVKLGP